MTPAALLGIALVAVLIGIVLFRAIPSLQTYLLYRGKRLITCPETLKTEAVDVAAGKAAAWTLINEPILRLDRCSRWPERQDCGQECLQQIEADPENCLVWNIVSNWYEGKTCVYCRKRFGRLHHLDHAPALLRSDGVTTEWDRFRPEQLSEVFSVYQPVCWNCHITQSFRHEHPELVVERRR
jgi:hypothetical protein